MLPHGDSVSVLIQRILTIIDEHRSLYTATSVVSGETIAGTMTLTNLGEDQMRIWRL